MLTIGVPVLSSQASKFQSRCRHYLLSTSGLTGRESEQLNLHRCAGLQSSRCPWSGLTVSVIRHIHQHTAHRPAVNHYCSLHQDTHVHACPPCLALPIQARHFVTMTTVTTMTTSRQLSTRLLCLLAVKTVTSIRPRQPVAVGVHYPYKWVD